MSDSDQRIREMVRTAVEEDPAIKNRVLLDRARQIDANAVEGLSLRQFHAKYRLPVARMLSDASTPAKPRKRASRPRRRQESVSDDAKRVAIRDVFRRFAVQLSHAESRSEIVRAIARIDEFVEDVFRSLAAGEDGADTPAPRRTRRVTRSSAPERGEPRAETAAEAGPPAARLPSPASSAPSQAAPAQAPEPAEAQAIEPRARDMARRRRPKGLKSPAAADAAPSAEISSTQPDAVPAEPDHPAEEPPRAPERAGFSLSDDLEEFRRRRADRERTRPVR